MMSITPYTDEISSLVYHVFKAIQPFVIELTEIISYVRKMLDGLVPDGPRKAGQTYAYAYALQLLAVGAPNITPLNRYRGRSRYTGAQRDEPVSYKFGTAQSSAEHDNVEVDHIQDFRPPFETPFSESIGRIYDQSLLLEPQNPLLDSISNTKSIIRKALQPSFDAANSSLAMQKSSTKLLFTQPVMELSKIGSRIVDQLQDNFQVPPISVDSTFVKETRRGVHRIIEESRIIEEEGAVNQILHVDNSADLLRTVARSMSLADYTENLTLDGLLSTKLGRIVDRALLPTSLISNRVFDVARNISRLIPSTIHKELADSASLTRDAVYAGIQAENQLSEPLSPLLNTVGWQQSYNLIPHFIKQLLSSSLPIKEATSILEGRNIPSNLSTLLSPELRTANWLGLDSTPINRVSKLFGSIPLKFGPFSGQVQYLAEELRSQSREMLKGAMPTNSFSVLTAASNLLVRKDTFSNISGFLDKNTLLSGASTMMAPFSSSLFNFTPLFQQIPKIPHTTGLANFVEGAIGIRERIPSYSDIQDSLARQFSMQPALQPILQPALQPILQPALQPIFQQIPKIPHTTGLANFVEGAIGIRERIPSYSDIQDQLVVPNRLKNLGGVAARFEDFVAKISPAGKKEFVIQQLPRRASGSLKYVWPTLRSQAEKKRANIVSKIKPELMHMRSDGDGRSRTDTVFAPGYNDTSDGSSGMEPLFNGELVADHDGSYLLKDNDTTDLKAVLEDKIESILSRELLKYSGGSSYPETSKGLFNNMSENEDEESELRVLKRMLEQILNDQLRNYYGLQT